MDFWKFPFLSSNILRIFPKLKLTQNWGSYAEKIPLHGAQENTREARMRRRQEQISVLEAFLAAENLFYGSGIDDSF